MKKLSHFLSHKKERAKHFVWDESDIVTSIEEKETHWMNLHDIKPKENKDYKGEPEEGTPKHNSFLKHHESLSKIHHEHMSYYKGDSYSTNHYLRHGKPQEYTHPTEHIHDHIKHMDEVTNHTIQHSHKVYRGGGKKTGSAHKFPKGHVFQDHGYTGTTFRKKVAADFSYERSQNDDDDDSNPHRVKTHHKMVMHVIHVPKGSKGHYINAHPDSGHFDEHELLLHRGTKFKVTHHTEDKDFHYVHSKVIGHEAKHYDHGTPGRHSKTAYEAAGSDGVTKTPHEHPFNPHGAKVHIKINPAHLEAIKKAKIAHAMEKAKS